MAATCHEPTLHGECRGLVLDGDCQLLHLHLNRPPMCDAWVVAGYARQGDAHVVGLNACHTILNSDGTCPSVAWHQPVTQVTRQENQQ